MVTDNLLVLRFMFIWKLRLYNLYFPQETDAIILATHFLGGGGGVKVSPFLSFNLFKQVRGSAHHSFSDNFSWCWTDNLPVKIIFCDVTRDTKDRHYRFQCVIWGFHSRCSSLQGFMTPCWLLISFWRSRRVILVPTWRWRQQAHPKHR